MRWGEQAILAAVRSRVFTIDEQGRVWRHGRRAEHRTTLGYLQLRLMIDGVRYSVGAHRIVWMHLHGPLPDGWLVNHLNGVKDDNRPENLEPTTHSGNTVHARRVLGRVDQRGGRNHRARLTDAAVVEIRHRRGQGESLRSIAADFGVSDRTISKIALGQRWGHVEDAVEDAAGHPLLKRLAAANPVP